ncbi:NPHP3 [Mytilus edulis]|uniref:NPHP3 n=1 Tax=Mytilus edulis TaxID=6550 RepID=A0A8S3S8K1_MYTED|nr:NPHP3 [Mytilus edulis]
MEDEREELTRRYFPKIHHLCSLHGIQFVAVDMRWGITSEASSSAQVINICLRELDRSDIFVGFFGQRYGWFGAEDKALQANFDNAVQHYPWLDRFRDKSVTELEFLHGHLNNPGDMPSVMCFRDKGAELMFNDIWKYLTEVLLKDAEVESKSSRINSEHDAFLSNRSLLYVGNEDYIKKLTANINLGPAGSGKSSLLSSWLKQIKSDATYSDLCVVYHFVGAAEESTGVRMVISTKSSDHENIKELVEERKFQQIEILPLTESEQKELSEELVVFGYFRLLDKKIDSLISCSSVVDLFDKVLGRLEEDYNVKEYQGNLVEQNVLFTDRFAFTELEEAVSKRYFEDKQEQKLPPKFDHDKVKESKLAHELPWLYLKFNDISGLQKSLFRS